MQRHAIDDILDNLPPLTDETPQTAPSNNGHRLPFDMPAFVARHGLRVKTIKQDGAYGTKYILDECPFDPNHKAPDSYCGVMPSGAPYFHCSHNSCGSNKWQQFRERFEPGYRNSKPQTNWDEASRKHHGFTHGEQQQPGKQAEPFPTISCEELEAGDYDDEYLIDNVVVAHQPGIIAAPQKSFKTTFAADLSLSLATAGKFLGYFHVSRAVPVLFMSAESGMGTLKKTARSISTAAGIPWPAVPNLRWSELVPKMGNAAEMKRLELTYNANPFDVLIVDPVYKSMPNADPGNIFAQGELLGDFSRFCDERGVTLILVHHLRKSLANPYEAPELTDLAWSGFAEHCRWWVLIGRREKYIPPSPHRLWFGTGGSAGHSGLWAVDVDQGLFVPGQTRQWEVTIRNAGEAQEDTAKRQNAERESKASARAKADAATLREALKRFPAGETKTAIRNAAVLNTDRLDPALRLLIDQMEVVPCEVLKSGKKTPLPGFKLTTGDDRGLSPGIPRVPTDQTTSGDRDYVYSPVPAPGGPAQSPAASPTEIVPGGLPIQEAKP